MCDAEGQRSSALREGFMRGRGKKAARFATTPASSAACGERGPEVHLHAFSPQEVLLIAQQYAISVLEKCWRP